MTLSRSNLEMPISDLLFPRALFLQGYQGHDMRLGKDSVENNPKRRGENPENAWNQSPAPPLPHPQQDCLGGQQQQVCLGGCDPAAAWVVSDLRHCRRPWPALGYCVAGDLGKPKFSGGQGRGKPQFSVRTHTGLSSTQVERKNNQLGKSESWPSLVTASQSSGLRMTFWQENYAFIKDVYDMRHQKMAEWMENVEKVLPKRRYVEICFTCIELNLTEEGWQLHCGNIESSWQLTRKYWAQKYWALSVGKENVGKRRKK